VAEVAVASKNGLLQLWKVAQVTQIGKLKMDAVTSFDRSSLSVKLKKWGVKAELEPISVKAMSLQEILEEHQMVSPDIVVIDTEGMDRIVLDQVEFSEKGPALIQFEINNLNSKDLEYCRQRLIRSGYKFILTERDAICIHPAYLRYLVG
jgi:FkbM family methyltransferase